MGDFRGFFDGLDSDQRVRGRQFERICKWFLLNDPTYRATLRTVWLWDDWPGRWGVDAGIDLMAEDHDGRLWAIQAKAYAPENAVTKNDVSRFLAESARSQISYRLLIATTDKLDRIARRTLDEQEKSVGFVGLADLLAAELDWPESLDDLRPSQPVESAKPRDYQREAIDAVIAGFGTADRGQLIMACGTGKTLTAQFITGELNAVRTLVLVPSLSLLKQIMRVWQANAQAGFEVLPVCSDATVGRDEDAPITRASELGVPVTTDPADIAAFLRETGPRVVFSTYQSSPRIAAAQALADVPGFDLVIADEAHRCAGPVSSEFATILDPAAIRAERRLFMTATPRYYTGRIVKVARESDFEVASMDDEAKFGTVFHRLGFSEAIGRDLLTDYQVAVVGVDDATYRQWAETGRFVRRDDGAETDARSLAGQIGLAKAIKKYNLRRTISFHSRVKSAREFAAELPDVIGWMPADQRPAGTLWAKHASGEMSAGKRHVLLQHLSRLDDGERGLLANARCLAEGVDVPALDGVAFIDPRRSEVDIVQAVGRAIRKADDKSIGTIVIPVFIDADADPEEALNDSVFKPVWDIIKALRAHDDELAEQIDSLRRAMGRRHAVPKLPDKIRLDIPVTVEAAFAEAFDTRLVEQTSATWEFWFGLLERYVADNGSALVPAGFRVDEYALGQWVTRQRRRWDGLASDQRERLQRLPGWVLNVRDERWETGYAHLVAYVKEHGTAAVTYKFIFNGYPLGAWENKQRNNWDNLSKERQERLSQLPGWVTDVRDAQWEEGFQRLLAYVDENATSLVPNDFTTEDYPLGRWVAKQRTRWQQLRSNRQQRLAQLPDWTLNTKASQWEEGFKCLRDYADENGTAMVPADYTIDGFKLGRWVIRQRARWGELVVGRQELLSQLPGWTCDTRDAQWEEGFKHLQEYVDQHGDALPQASLVVDGYRLGQWVSVQRGTWKSLTAAQRGRLQQLPGWTVNVLDSRWEEGFSRLLEYVDEHGSALVPQSYVVDGYKLGSWVAGQRSRWAKLDEDRKRRLQELPGWATNVLDARWEEGFQKLSEYVKEHGAAVVTQSYVVDEFKLGQWVSIQRTGWESLSTDRKQRLSQLPGWTVDTRLTQWETAFQYLQDYVKANGTAMVPSEFVVDGFKLGRWVVTQRRRWNLLTDERRELLAKTPGWVTDTRTEQWNQALRHLNQYIQENRHALVPKDYVTSDGFNLGTWVANKRSRWSTLDDDQKRKLQAIPEWVTDVSNAQWEEGFRHLGAYVSEHGDALVSRSYTADGFRLGQWVGVQRSNWTALKKDRQERLAGLPGWAVSLRDTKWEAAFQQLQQYAKDTGSAHPAQTYVTDDGFKLGTWVAIQLAARRRGSMSADRRHHLEALPGWSWDALEDRWGRNYELVVDYAAEHGDALVPQSYRVADCKLGAWVNEQRSVFAEGKLSAARQQRLEALPGWVWNFNGVKWDEGFQHVKRFIREHGHSRVPGSYEVDGYRLGQWVANQRKTYARGALRKDRGRLLEALPGWEWTARLGP